MATKVLELLVDDLDGSTIEDGAGGTIRFSLDGTRYEIDLNATNAEALRSALAPYIGSARKEPRSARTSPKTASAKTPDLAAVRAWARAEGIAVSVRGRVSADVIAAYEAAQ